MAGASITKCLDENLRVGALLGEYKLLSIGDVGAVRQDNDDNNTVFFNSNNFLNINQSNNNININNYDNFNDACNNNDCGADCFKETSGVTHLLKDNEVSKDFDII